MTGNCRTSVPLTTQRPPVANQKTTVTCYECGKQGHYRNNLLSDIAPTALDTKHTIELADGRLIGVDAILRGYTLNFLNHTFNLDLIPVELESFDVIIRMDWLTKYRAVIIYDEILVRVPFDNETLMIRGDRSKDRRDSRLNTTSCSKAEKCMQKGCHVFLAHITAKKTEEKSKEKVAPIARSPYRLDLSEMSNKEHEEHLKLILELLKKEDLWKEKEEEAFQLLKQKLCSASILALPEGIENFVIFNDASHKDLGVVLMKKEKENVVADALSRKERIKLLRVRALVMTIDINLPSQILNAQAEAMKEENVKEENLRGMDKEFKTRPDGTLYIRNKIWLPCLGD
ncbi:putative reverse transcriptase domain-containing protein [Tanacetum coccineum]|uniref:Reverse transcriptase domain-containing protein n=1 Tax=Tanacetum coccineum TaxID=301880 RepID=A0ABQ5H4E4_9ASTR